MRQERAVAVRFVGPFEGTRAAPPVSPGDFLVGESFCQGDSGGPALARDTDAVVGVATRGGHARTGPDAASPPGGAAAPCLDGASGEVFAFYTQLAPFASVAKSAFAASGHAPWLEGRPPPWWTFDDGGCALSSRPRGRTRFGGGAVAGAALIALSGLLRALHRPRVRVRVARRSARRPRRDRTRG
jgi:hypothetical protein